MIKWLPVAPGTNPTFQNHPDHESDPIPELAKAKKAAAIEEEYLNDESAFNFS